MAEEQEKKKRKYTMSQKVLEGRKKGGETRKGVKMSSYTVSEKKLEHLKKLHESNKTREISDEEKRKNSESLKKKYAEDEEWSNKQKENARRIVQDPEVRKKNSESVRKIQAADEYKQRHKKAMSRPEVKEKIRQSQLGRKQTEEQKRRTGIRSKKYQLERWSKIPLKERRELTAKWRRASQITNISSLEIEFSAFLSELNIEYIHQHTISSMNVDFYIPSLNLVIEVNGCYPHCCEKCGHNDNAYGIPAEEKRKQDIKRGYFLRSQGYEVYILWEHDIKDIKSEGMLKLLERLNKI